MSAPANLQVQPQQNASLSSVSQNVAQNLSQSFGYFTIGGAKITYNAAATLIAGMLVSIVMAWIGPAGIVMGALMFLAFCLAAYNVNCALVGQCTLLANILTIIYVIYALLSGFAIAVKADPSRLDSFIPSSRQSATRY